MPPLRAESRATTVGKWLFALVVPASALAMGSLPGEILVVMSALAALACGLLSIEPAGPPSRATRWALSALVLLLAFTILQAVPLPAGVYSAGTFEITKTLTLDARNDPDAVFIFTAASTLVTASASKPPTNARRQPRSRTAGGSRDPSTPLIPATFPEEKVETFGSDVPLGRTGQPNEVAPCYVFLASDDSSYMTGRVLHPNGGEIVNG